MGCCPTRHGRQAVAQVWEGSRWHRSYTFVWKWFVWFICDQWCLEPLSYHRTFVVQLQGIHPLKLTSSENQWLEIGRFIFLLGCHVFRGYVGFREGDFNCRKINANANQSTCAIFTLSYLPTFTGRWCCPQLSSATSWKVFMNLDQYGHVSIFYIHHGWIAGFLTNKWRHIWHNSLGSLQGNVSFLIRNLAGNEHLGMAKRWPSVKVKHLGCRKATKMRTSNSHKDLIFSENL